MTGRSSPAGPARRWVASYDVTTNGRRYALGRLLEAHGHRVLYSVFELDLRRGEIEELEAAAIEHLRPGDQLLLLPRCAACDSSGQGSGLERAGSVVVAL